MSQFVRFRVDDDLRFAALQRVFMEIKAVKNLDFAAETEIPEDAVVEHDNDKLKAMMPVEICKNFDWPDLGEVDTDRLDPNQSVAISQPGAFLGERWSFARILDLIDMSEYSLTSCEQIGPGVAELRVETYSYPYGGLNCLIALVEGFGFKVIGVNECGQYESFLG